MRRSLFCVLLLWICAAAFSPTSSRAESGNPSDAFVDAWMTIQKAEKDSGAERFQQALAKFREAAVMFDKISKDYPAWSPTIVAYRKVRTAEAIAYLEEKLQFYGPPAALPKAPPEASATPELRFGGILKNTGEPSDAFLDAWTLVQEAEKTEVAGNYEQALAKFQEAARKLEKISKERPAWNPNILRYRQERTEAAIERVQSELKHPPPPRQPPDPKPETPQPLHRREPVFFPEPKDLCNGIFLIVD